jgi:hypothetical protein
MSKVILYIFPGILEEAQITGDQCIEDISCPYCESPDGCAHLLACIDPLNYNVGGRLNGLDQEFIFRIKKAFLPYLKGGGKNPVWGCEEISELWEWAHDNWSDDDGEIEIDSDVLFRLISVVLQEAAEHADFGSQLEGFGTETEYTLIFDDQPDRVLTRSMESLDSLLKPEE